MSRYKEVLLVDDNEADHFISRRIMQKVDLAENYVEVYNGEEALEYVRSGGPGGASGQAELIFLDINMPRMNGWEFVDEFRRLPSELQTARIVMMLTTSNNDRDRTKAREAGVIKSFINKPLTVESLEACLAADEFDV